jgi:hypothetical protein
MTPNAAKRLWFQQKVCFEEKFVVRWSGFFDSDRGAGGPLIDLGELHRSHWYCRRYSNFDDVHP